MSSVWWMSLHPLETREFFRGFFLEFFYAAACLITALQFSHLRLDCCLQKNIVCKLKSSSINESLFRIKRFNVMSLCLMLLLLRRKMWWWKHQLVPKTDTITSTDLQSLLHWNLTCHSMAPLFHWCYKYILIHIKMIWACTWQFLLIFWLQLEKGVHIKMIENKHGGSCYSVDCSQ